MIISLKSKSRKYATCMLARFESVSENLRYDHSHKTSEKCFHVIICIEVVVNFISKLIFIFLLCLGMVMYANEFETKEK